MKIYRGEYKDIETDLNNANIQVTKRIDIIDGNSNPYNIAYTSQVIGPNIEFTFTFDPLPAAATSTAIGYSSDGGLTWASNTGGVISPRVLTLPFAAYIFTFTIHLPSGNIIYNFEDEIVPLEMTDNPVRDIVIDNDEDKFTPIRSRQLEINIYSSNTVKINSFSQGGDNSYKVNYYVDSVLNFTGFLSLGDLQSEFLPDPNVISLVAVDGLGFLKDIPLTDFNGDTPVTENPILDYLLIALSKTGLELNLSATFNIREVTALSLDGDATGAGHFFKFCYLDAKTFEDEPGTCINCFDVITQILGEEAMLCQHLGEWRIIRIDEIEHGVATQTVYQWNWQGNFLGKFTETHEKNVGVGEAYSWMNDDAIVSLERLIKESRLFADYVTPKEIPCNDDFSRGTIVSDTPTKKIYDLECWDKLFRDGTGEHTSAATIQLHVDFIDNYEVNRYVKFFDNGVFNYIKSDKIWVNQNDKFSLNVSRRMETDHSPGGVDPAVQIFLYGNDGTFWTHHGKDPGAAPDSGLAYWEQCDSLFQTNQHFHVFAPEDDFDDTKNIDLYSDEGAAIPVAGYLQILVYTSALWGATEDVFIQKVTFELLEYINGSYGKYTGHEHVVAQTEDTRNVREKQVFIFDSPHRQFKGALLVYDSVNVRFPLAGLFYNAAQEPAGPVNEKRYGEIQAFDVWNQYNRNMVKFDGTIDHSNPVPDLISKYFLTDSNENTADRIFLLLHYELDTHLCEWEAFFMEVSKFDSKVYEGHSFKYITG